MASDQFPMFKLATLLARQMSSPIATRVKTYAKSHPAFGTAVCVRVAEVFRGGEWAARVWALRLAGTALRPARPPMPRQQAVDLGADLIGEIVIFTLGSLIIIFEVNRQAAIKEGKALHIKSEWLAVKLSLEELQTELALQQQEMDSLHETLVLLASPAEGRPAAEPARSVSTPRAPDRPAVHQPSDVDPTSPQSSRSHDSPFSDSPIPSRLPPAQKSPQGQESPAAPPRDPLGPPEAGPPAEEHDATNKYK